jgi:hypothetical protein
MAILLKEDLGEDEFNFLESIAKEKNNAIIESLYNQVRDSERLSFGRFLIKNSPLHQLLQSLSVFWRL